MCHPFYVGLKAVRKGMLVAATGRNVKSMLKSRKLRSRKGRAFVVNAKAFDGRHVVGEAKRAAKKKNYALARKLLDDYALSD